MSMTQKLTKLITDAKTIRAEIAYLDSLGDIYETEIGYSLQKRDRLQDELDQLEHEMGSLTALY